MFRIDGATAAALLPSPAAAGAPGYFQNETIVTPDWLNMVQEELLALLAAAAVSPSKTTFNQVKTALDTLYGLEGSLGTTGWVRFRRGALSAPLIMQWGPNTSGTAGAVTLPIAFPTRGVCVLAIDADAAPEVCGAAFGSAGPNVTSINLYGIDVNFWLAIGY